MNTNWNFFILRFNLKKYYRLNGQRAGILDGGAADSEEVNFLNLFYYLTLPKTYVLQLFILTCNNISVFRNLEGQIKATCNYSEYIKYLAFLRKNCQNCFAFVLEIVNIATAKRFSYISIICIWLMNSHPWTIKCWTRSYKVLPTLAVLLVLHIQYFLLVYIKWSIDHNLLLSLCFSLNWSLWYF